MIEGALIFLLVSNLWCHMKLTMLQTKVSKIQIGYEVNRAHVNTFMNAVLDFMQETKGKKL